MLSHGCNMWFRRSSDGWDGDGDDGSWAASQEEDFRGGSEGAAVANFGTLIFQGNIVFKDTPDVSTRPAACCVTRTPPSRIRNQRDLPLPPAPTLFVNWRIWMRDSTFCLSEARCVFCHRGHFGRAQSSENFSLGAPSESQQQGFL